MLNLISFSPSNFSRYVSQIEHCIDEPNDTNERTQQSPPLSSAINDIPSLMSIPTTAVTPVITTTTTPPSPPSSPSSPPPPPPPPPPPVITTSIPQKMTMASPVIKEDIEPLRFPQHGPGPIQRPTKLTCPSTQQSTSTPASSFLTNSIQSPETPDVLDQINRLLDHQNSTTIIPSTTNVNNSSITINDLATPNTAWTTYSPSEWPSKYESSWPLTSIQSPSVSLTTQVQNPFAHMSSLNEPQRQTTREDPSFWSSVLGTATPRSLSSSIRTQRASAWNEIFSSTVPSSTTDSTKPTNNSWLKFWPAPDPSSTDGTLPNGHETEPNNPFWSLNTLTNEPVVASTIPNQQHVPSSLWWSNASSDENNNKSQTNQLNDNITNNRDQSRWDFAR